MTTLQRPPLRLGSKHQFCIYAVSILLLLSGFGWLIAHYFFAPFSEFGTPAAPSEPLWLRIHGAAAMGALIILGSVFPGHIGRAFTMRRNLFSGFLMLSIAALLILTGYGLYYFGDEETRPWISLLHWTLGLASIAILILHVKLGKRRPSSARAFTQTRVSAHFH
ncbi:hypothetical protein [Beijerinckia indica]|uniref:Putative transmembrane protein n=1 Tax=Beijerinckia indica subsp. indica (strain ATCC 9039 / DSM 1715 / NCIMB 8712) TaxID=395963 RepID=B2IEQ1_BEII9|nr:hypothetical protein [Beijerinckia indica]ACB96991.1 putative transmembrane protein [Beijerinckia indica subsp. indica ATCC 9039]